MSQVVGEPVSPDESGIGFIREKLDPTRYSGHTNDPHEVAGIVRRLMPCGARVLDVGCGTGSVSLIANSGKNNVFVGIEPDVARAEVARASGLDVVCGFLDHEFLRKNGRFDVVVLTDVLEHLAAPSLMLELVKEALLPDGCVIVSVPNVAHWSIRAMLLVGRFDYAEVGLLDATHLRWFTRRSLISLVAANNLQVVEIASTAGTGLSLYHEVPFSFLPGVVRRQMIRCLIKIWPTMFACQVIVKAKGKTS